MSESRKTLSGIKWISKSPVQLDLKYVSSFWIIIGFVLSEIACYVCRQHRDNASVRKRKRNHVFSKHKIIIALLHLQNKPKQDMRPVIETCIETCAPTMSEKTRIAWTLRMTQCSKRKSSFPSQRKAHWQFGLNVLSPGPAPAQKDLGSCNSLYRAITAKGVSRFFQRLYLH